MSRAAAIFWTLIAYKVVMVAVGLWAQRKSRSHEDFFIAGRGLGPWVASLSASASSSSVWTLIGVSGFAYARGISALWIFFGCMGGFALNWYVVAPRLRASSQREGTVTLSEVLAGPPGRRGRRAVMRVASTIVLVSLLTYVASQFAGAGKTFAETFDIDLDRAVLIGAGVVVLYTMLGGFWAVSVTDTLQGALMSLAALALPLAGLWHVGGFRELWRGLEGAGPHFIDVFNGAGTLAGVGLMLGLLGIGLGYPGQPHVVNRLMALRDDHALRTGRRVAMLWGVVVYSGMIIAGLAARVLLADIGDHENAFVALTQATFSPVVAGIMIAAALSAIMSTADSQLLVAAAAVSHDLRAADTPPPTLLRTRGVVLGLSALAVLVALHGNQEVFSSVLFAWSAMGAAFGPLLIVTLWWRRPSPGFALAAMLMGFASAVFAYLHPDLKGGPAERVLPFAIAGCIAWWGARRSVSPQPDTHDRPGP